MDCREVAGEPCWQVDVGDRTVLSAERLSNIGERTAESIGRENQALRGDHGGCGCRPPVAPVRQPRIEHIDHAGLDGEPDQRVRGLDRQECRPGARAL